mmetsp:Transcript_3185/g.9750  ORF Transcript_3185/g.9750 Transcript_3185/m.9750 type:complete len:215 (-) Transcript_3185:101-745(-)
MPGPRQRSCTSASSSATASRASAPVHAPGSGAVRPKPLGHLRVQVASASRLCRGSTRTWISSGSSRSSRSSTAATGPLLTPTPRARTWARSSSCRATSAPTSISSWSTTSCTRRTRSRFTGTAEGGWRVAAGGEPAALFPLGGAALTARGVRRGRRRRGLSRRPCPWAGRRGGPGAHALRTPLRARRGAQQRCACRCYSRRLWPVCVDLHLDGF